MLFRSYYVEETPPPHADPEPDPVPAFVDKTEEKTTLRRSLQALVSQASIRFRVEHRKIHATLNQRFGGPIASASSESISRRRQAVLQWLERDRYDGLR